MALPLLALGKIASSIVAGTAKGLAVAAKATAKGAATTAKVAGKAAIATSKGLGKAGAATARGFGKVTSSSGKGLRKVGKSMSNIGKGKSKSTKITRIRKTTKKIKKSIIEYNKKSKKLRLNQERMRRNMLERQKQRSKEKKLESKKGPFQNALKSVTGAPMSFMDKLLGFGGLLLTGILVNSLDDIIKKFKDFKENNSGLFTAVGNVVKVIKNSFTYLFDEMTKPFGEEGSLDWLAKFDDDGNLESGQLKNLQDTIGKFGSILAKINPFIKNEKGQIDLKTNIPRDENDPSKGNMTFSETFSYPDNPITVDGVDTGMTEDEYNKATYYVDQNGRIRRKDDNTSPIGSNWGFINKEILDRKIYDSKTKSIIQPVEKRNNLGDQSSLGFGDSTTIIVATQPVMQPFPIPYAVPVKSKSKANNSMVAFNNPLWMGVA